MTKVLITADIHNGVSGRLNDTIWSMKRMDQYAEDNNIQNIFVLGDLFHDRTSLDIKVYAQVYDLLSNSKKTWHCFPGNHDMYLKNSWEINSIHPLNKVANIIENYDTTIQIGPQKFYILPFIHQEKEYLNKLSTLNEKATEDDILLTHIGISGATMNMCFLIQNWNAINFENTKFKRIYAGHFHCHQKVGTKSWCPGSPIPFRFDDGEVDHGFIIYDIKENTHEFIKTFDTTEEKPPDFITLTDDDIDTHATDIKSNRIKIILTKDHTVNELEEIKQKLTSEGAMSVKFQDKKQDIQYKIGVKIKESSKPMDIFESWIDSNKPEWAHKELLIEYFKSIYEEAENRQTEEEENE